jgi:transcriptional regulator
MYIPQHFEVTDREEIFAFIKANAFGQLTSSVNGRLFTSHLPFLISDDRDSLFCHVAKGNPQWQAIESQEVLVTFQGPHDYISPSWYSSPGVPTWNYQAAHIYGKPQLVKEKDKLVNIIHELTDIYESSFEEPWVPKYDGSMLNFIVGIEIKITDVQCKFKLSQNRSESDRKQVIKGLQENGSSQLSRAMNNGA